jgi:hypothetical protein
MTSFKYNAHLCEAPTSDPAYNRQIVSEIEELAAEIKPKSKLEEALTGGGRGGLDEVDQPMSTHEEVARPAPLKGSPEYFKDQVRKYVRIHRTWNKGSELQFIYKAYFTAPRCRFNIIALAGDIIIGKMAASKSINRQFSDQWFKGILDIIINCVNFE